MRREQTWQIFVWNTLYSTSDSFESLVAGCEDSRTSIWEFTLTEWFLECSKEGCQVDSICRGLKAVGPGQELVNQVYDTIGYRNVLRDLSAAAIGR